MNLGGGGRGHHITVAGERGRRGQKNQCACGSDFAVCQMEAAFPMWCWGGKGSTLAASSWLSCAWSFPSSRMAGRDLRGTLFFSHTAQNSDERGVP